MMNPEPQKEHAWLQKMVGDWTSEMESAMGPGEPCMNSQGSESVRSLGGLWIVAEGTGDMPGGGQATMVMTLGYDPVKGNFVGTWVGSMMTHLWVYTGELDPSGRMLLLNAEGPSMAGDGTTAKYQDVIEFVDDNHRILRGRLLADDGSVTEFMTAHYWRKG